MDGQSDQLGFVQEIKIWFYEQMVYAQPSICSEKWDAQIPMEFWDTSRLANLGQMTRPYSNQQQKRELAKLWNLLSWLTTE